MKLLSGFTANAKNDSWAFDATPTFKNGYDAKDSENQHRVDEALSMLGKSKFPNRLGEIKSTPDGRVCVYDIGLKYRMSYRVSFPNRTIQLIRVCDHKTVYGKD